MNLTPETRALFEAQAIALRADILYDLAAAASAVEATYDPDTWEPRGALRELKDLRRALRSVFVGLGWELDA
jgi:hypothetical protein